MFKSTLIVFSWERAVIGPAVVLACADITRHARDTVVHDNAQVTGCCTNTLANYCSAGRINPENCVAGGPHEAA